MCLGLDMGSNYIFATVVETVNHPTVFFLFFPEAIRCSRYWLGQKLSIHNLDFPSSFADRYGHIIMFAPVEMMSVCSRSWVFLSPLSGWKMAMTGTTWEDTG